jgi:hypothetical protein
VLAPRKRRERKHVGFVGFTSDYLFSPGNIFPEGTYDFSLWISAWFPAAPATLEFFFNGASIRTFGVSSTTGLWESFASTWNSGAATSLTIGIVDNNTIVSGNDFSLDDISLTSRPSAVPEPSGLGLLALCLSSLLLRRRRS